MAAEYRGLKKIEIHRNFENKSKVGQMEVPSPSPAQSNCNLEQIT